MVEKRTISELKNSTIKGIDTLKTMVATRKEIYNFIGKENPLAIIDYRQASVKIDETDYFIILKKVGTLFSVRVIWDRTNGVQYFNN